MSELADVLGQRKVVVKSDGKDYTLRSPSVNQVVKLEEKHGSLAEAMTGLKNLRHVFWLCLQRGGHTDMTEEQAGDVIPFGEMPDIVAALFGGEATGFPSPDSPAPGPDSSGG